MIYDYLLKALDCARLHNSYLINTDNPDKAYEELCLFACNLLGVETLGANADFITVKKQDVTTKNISIDQIRHLQRFLYKTSIVSGKKIAIIYAADEMNLNAANACLKILEEPSSNSYLFLISSNAASIIPTIRSRCAKLNYFYDKHLSRLTDTNIFITPLRKTTTSAEKIDFINRFGTKNRDLWQKFTIYIEELVAKMCKKSIIPNYPLSIEEDEIFKKIKNDSREKWQQKYNYITEIIRQTEQFDLDLRASCALILSRFDN